VKPNASLKISCFVVNRESASALASSGAAQAATRVPRMAFLAINLKLSVIMVSIPFSLKNKSYSVGNTQKSSLLLQNLFQNLKQTRRQK
jgi:predicted RNase H-like nuclease